MRRLFAAAMMGLAFAPASQAQSTRWNDPTGSWSMDIVSQRWGHADPLPTGLPGLTLLAAPADSPPGNEIRMCFVMQTPLAPTNATPSAIRASAFTEADAAALPGMNHQRDIHVAHGELDGVAVAEIDSVSDNGGLVRHHRLFDLTTGAGAQRVNVDCFWSAAAPQTRVAEVQAILASVHINSETSP